MPFSAKPEAVSVAHFRMGLQAAMRLKIAPEAVMAGQLSTDQQ